MQYAPFSNVPLNTREKMNKCSILYADHDKLRRDIVIKELGGRLYLRGKNEQVYSFEIADSDDVFAENLFNIVDTFSGQKKYLSGSELRFVFTTAGLYNANRDFTSDAGIEFARRCSGRIGVGKFHSKLKIILLDSEKPLNIPEKLFNKIIIDNPEGYLQKQSQERLMHEHWQNLYHPWTDKIVSYVMSNRIAR